jgi:hypothetical protein
MGSINTKIKNTNSVSTNVKDPKDLCISVLPRTTLRTTLRTTPPTDKEKIQILKYSTKLIVLCDTFSNLNIQGIIIANDLNKEMYGYKINNGLVGQMIHSEKYGMSHLYDPKEYYNKIAVRIYEEVCRFCKTDEARMTELLHIFEPEEKSMF